MFFVKNNLSYLYFVIILGIFLKRIAFVLGDLLCGSIVDIFPFDTMSIRRFCKYYRIANTIFWSESDSKRAKKAVNIEDDVEYYTHHGLHPKLEGCDLDSEKEFKHFAKDHYGELGLSRMNVGVTDITVDWLIALASKVMARTGSEYHSLGGDFSSAKGELRKLNVTAGLGGNSYMAYQKVPARLEAFCKELNQRRKGMDPNDVAAVYDLSFWAHYELVAILGSMPHFYEAFDIPEGSKMYIAPEERAAIW